MADDEKKVIALKPSQEKLLDRIDIIQKENVIDRNELGFSTRIFVQCSLPHRDPGNDVSEWTRTNGNLCLTISPVKYVLEGKKTSTGFPYGNIPRLLLLYVCTQAIQKKQKEIWLGDSLSQFMRNIGLEVSGGKQGTIPRLKDQATRLFRANIDFTYGDEEGIIGVKANIAHKFQLWWDSKQPEQSSLFNNYVELTQEFYDEIMSYPVPLDVGIISAIKQSPLALDLYTWLTHRVVSLDKPIRIPWVAISEQVGSEYKDVKDLKRKAKEALRKIQALWPNLKIEEVPGGIRLKPSSPSVPSKLFALTSPPKE